VTFVVLFLLSDFGLTCCAGHCASKTDLLRRAAGAHFVFEILSHSSGLWECGKLGVFCRVSQGLRETVENHNAEIFARNLREWFSTGFLTPVISTARCIRAMRR